MDPQFVWTKEDGYWICRPTPYTKLTLERCRGKWECAIWVRVGPEDHKGHAFKRRKGTKKWLYVWDELFDTTHERSASWECERIYDEWLKRVTA